MLGVPLKCLHELFQVTVQQAWELGVTVPISHMRTLWHGKTR